MREKMRESEGERGNFFERIPFFIVFLIGQSETRGFLRISKKFEGFPKISKDFQEKPLI
jgi:hypothetical protein